MLDLKQIDQQILRASFLVGWFFMYPMGELLDSRNPNLPEGRRPILISDIDPLCGGKLAHRGAHVGEIRIHISGPKTDWLNQGCARPHARVRSDSPNAEICVARALVELHQMFPAKFTNHRDGLLAMWRNGDHIAPKHVTSLLRSTVIKNGLNPSAFPLHSLRAGGATALYRAAQDIDLAARFGRWETRPISA